MKIFIKKWIFLLLLKPINSVNSDEKRQLPVEQRSLGEGKQSLFIYFEY